MTRLPLEDIQGLVIRGYGMAYARFLLVQVLDAVAGRNLLEALLPEITTAVRWDGGKPPSTVNVGLTYRGLEALGLPRACLTSFPIEFVQGMRARSQLLGDAGRSAPEMWEPVWQEGSPHLWVGVHATSSSARDERCASVQRLLAQGGTRTVYAQDAQAVVRDGAPTTLEHFGYADGLGNPSFEGDGTEDNQGRGKLTPDGRWVPLATGELLLGHPDEGGEVSAAPAPPLLARNGTFMVYRKLHQNVASFRHYVDETGRNYPGGREKLAAKLMGRWRDGTPLERAPDAADHALATDPSRNNDFTYGRAPDGRRCPLGAHIRRANPRDAQGFVGRIATRHRIARRGMPYGRYTPEGEPVRDEDEHGIVFISLAASLERQFEFVQRQWVNYGNDAHQGNDRDPIAGNHDGTGTFTIQGATDPKDPPFLCTRLSAFVELRGGEYFFVPSLTALRLIASGRIDPR
jgi:Dyp-type peroxidase family